MAEDAMGARLCLVCTAKSDSAHFGVDSCRACAAFFRRTVTLNRKYICRQGTQRCEVSKDIRFICRNCRYVKCLSVGMHPDNVHSKPRKASTSSSYSPTELKEWRVPPINGGGDSDVEVKYEPQCVRSSSAFTCTISSPYLVTVASTEDMRTLMRIQEQYRVACLVRRTMENNATSPSHGMYTTEIDLDRPRPATWGSLNQCTKIVLKIMKDLAEACFDCLKELGEGEKWTLIQHFILAMFVFEGSYRSKKLFPGRNNIFMLSYITYIDVNAIDTFFSDAVGIEDKKHASRLLSSNIKSSLIDWMGSMLDRADLTETECIAIFGLIMFPPYLTKGTPLVARMTHDIHQQIFRELHIFYREQMRLEDYASRMAHITAIMLCVQGIVHKTKEDMEIYRLLNIFDENTFVYNVVQH